MIEGTYVKYNHRKYRIEIVYKSTYLLRDCLTGETKTVNIDEDIKLWSK